MLFRLNKLASQSFLKLNSTTPSHKLPNSNLNKFFHFRSMASTNALDRYLTPKEQPAFDKLTSTEKKYAHYISQAAWHGSKICLFQTSEESPIIYQVLQKFFHNLGSDLKNAEQDLSSKAGVSKEEVKDLLQYATVFYGNLGNYLSFGDTKVLPRLSQESFRKILETSPKKSEILPLFDSCKAKIYSSDSGVLSLGMDGKGVSTYYSSNITSADVALVREFMTKKGISPYNTRLWKNGDESYEIKKASAESKAAEVHKFNDLEIKITYGDHAPFMKKIVDNFKLALPYAANENQKKIYIKTFAGGEIDDHKDAQRWWIKDVGPVVETNIGFIESYQDPEGERGEFEGFVSVVNKEMSLKFSELVNNAEKFIKKLPWPAEFEKDKFLRPDFTSLEVLSFASSGVPAGINIPNYDDIRQTEGFKNVSLGNVLGAKSNDPLDYVSDKDQDISKKYETESFEVQVGIHELLGHGSGKLFSEKDGVFNFSKDLVNPVTGKPVAGYYKPGETYDNKFQSSASTMEECRAESVGIYLCLDRDLLKIFGHEGQEANDIIYVNWLLMVRAGIRALEFYTPEIKKWGQAHMQARYVILQVLLKAGIVELKQESDKLYGVLARDKIETIGKKAIGDFLLRLQTYKSTANVEEGTAWYSQYSAVNEEFVKLREFVLAHKKPRRIFVQAHTTVDKDGEVKLHPFEPTPEGVIKSFVTRFGPELVE